MTRERAELRLRPKPALIRDGVIASILFMIPVFIVAYVLTAADGTWPVVLATHLVTIVVLILVAWRYFAASIWVEPDSIAERGFFAPKRRFTADRIDRVVRADTFGHGAEPIPQLFVCGADCRVLVRMRGQFWSRDDMDTVASTLGVPVEVVPHTVSFRELMLEHPTLPYWFERNRVGFGVVVAAAGVLLAGLLWYGFTVLG